jgi:hypothetical protein
MKLLFQKLKLPLLVAVLLITPVLVAAQTPDQRIQMSSLDHLSSKASQTVDVNIDGRLMKMASKLLSDEGDEKEVKALVAGIKGIYVRSFEFETDGQYTSADVEGIRSQLRGPSWTRLVNVTSKKDGNLEVYLLMNGETVGGLAVLSTDERELTIVNIVGPVDIEKLARLEGHMGVPELGIEQKKEKKNDK